MPVKTLRRKKSETPQATPEEHTEDTEEKEKPDTPPISSHWMLKKLW